MYYCNGIGYPLINTKYIFSGVQARASNVCWSNNKQIYTLEDFKLGFPEFFKIDDTVDPPEYTPLFPIELFDLYLKEANSIVSECKWGDRWKTGIGLVIAHLILLKLRKSNPDGSLSGLINGGLAVGIATATTLGDASVKYDTSLTADPVYGTWNYTSYGQEYIQIVKWLNLGGMYAINRIW